MSEEPVKVKVKRKMIEGVQYLMDSDNILYNPQTQEEVGIWDEESRTIQPLPEGFFDDDDEEEEEEDKNTDVVKRFEFEGKNYLKSKKTGVIYNLDQEPIGKWNEAKNRIDFSEPDSEDDEEDDDENPDEDEGVYYLSEDTNFFSHTIEKTRPNGNVYHIPSFDTGVRLSNSFMSEGIVKFFTGAFNMGVPAFVETNGITRILGGMNSSYSYEVLFIGEDDEEQGRRLSKKIGDIVGIYSPSKKAFVGLFDFDKKHTTLETYDRDIVNAFRNYILPKVLFMKPETLYNYKPKELKVPPLEKALEDSKRDLDAETDPIKQKVLRSLMKKIISSIPKAKEFDDAELKKRERYAAEDAATKQKNKQLLAEQKRIKKEIKDKEDEEKRILTEKRKKEKEERDAAAAQVKAVNEELQATKKKKIQETVKSITPVSTTEPPMDIESQYKRAVDEFKLAKSGLAEAEENLKVATESNNQVQIALKTNSLKSARDRWNVTARKVKEIQKIRGEKTGVGIDSCWEGYEAIGLKKKGKKLVPNCVPLEGGKLKGMTNEDKKRKELLQYSDPKKALENAIKYLKKDIVFSLSTKPKKKYMVMNPDTMKWTHFGEMGYEDFLKHKDPIRQNNYLKRTANMKGKWKNDKYSANNLAREILWR